MKATERGRLRDYWDLTKPKVVGLIVFTALVGMFMAIPNIPTTTQLCRGLIGFIGIWLSAGAAAAINQLLDAKIDAQMARTSWRPLVVGRVRPWQVLVFASGLIAVSMGMLWYWVNTITAVLTFASLIGYAVIYTVYLKRATPQNIVIGGVAGAMPPMLGWATMTGLSTHSDWINSVVLVVIIFLWTPPHFWALAIYRREEYAKASIPMLPITHGVEYTKRQILIYTILLTIVTIVPIFTGMSGWIYGPAALILDGMFLWHAWRLRNPPNEAFAMKTFGFSIVHLSFLFLFLMIDHCIFHWAS